MAWRAAVLVVGGCLLLVGTGCPEEWRKGGINDRAIAKDTKEKLLKHPEDEERPECGEDEVAELKCDTGPCKWVCK